MNDLETLTQMFDRTGIKWRTGEPTTPPDPANGTVLTVTVDDEKVTGYWDFEAEFVFTPEGQLVRMGIWE